MLRDLDWSWVNWDWFLTWPLHLVAILGIGLVSLALIRRVISLLTERIATGYYRAYADALDSQSDEVNGAHLAAAAAGVETAVIARIKPRRRSIFTADGALSSVAGAAGMSNDYSPESQARRAQRARTVGSVLRSAANIIVGITMALMILSLFGLDEIVPPILASAGVLGVAIGFGAQSLVRDFLSGIFILIEDQFGVGDIVDLGAGAIGTVEKMDLRLTHVRSFDGTLWHVRNGEILRAGNRTQQWSRAVAEVRVPVGSDRDAVRAALGRAIESVEADPALSAMMLETPSVRGVDRITDGYYYFTVHGKVRPGSQWNVMRALLDASHQELAACHILGLHTVRDMPEE
jgi:small conductance mechanosensitive channel